MDEKPAVVKYGPPRVLRMNLTKQPLTCNDGCCANIALLALILYPRAAERRGEKKGAFQADINPLSKHRVLGTAIGRPGGT